jgi:hypothetical protein
MLLAPPAASATPAKDGHRDKAALTNLEFGESTRLAKLFATQQKLDATADGIRDAGGPDDQSGFAGDSVDTAAGTLTVYWHDQVPESVATQIDTARRAGVTVNLRTAKYSHHTLQKEADRLVGRTTTVGQVVTAGPAPDGSGVEIGVAPAAGRGHAIPNLQGTADAELGGNVDLITSIQNPPSLSWRGDDQVPYWGGALIQRDSGGACTSGFGVRGINGAASYIMTAAHCGDGRWRDGAGDLLGDTLSNTTKEYDGMLILTDAGDAVYEGESFADKDTNTGRTIRSSSSNHVGDSVCTGGSFSGTACGWSVKALDQSLRPIGYPVTIRGLVQAEAGNRVAGTGNGDSGGPVYTQNGNEGVARGIISLRSDVDSEIVPCNGVPSGPRADHDSRQCSWRWWYADINGLLSRLSVQFAP